MIVVTGATGFLGAHVLAQLEARGVAATALPATGASGRIDVSDALQVDAAFGALPGPPQVVVHLAAIAHRPAAAEEYRRVNFEGTRNVLDAAVRHGAVRFVLASSTAVYGMVEKGRPVTEDTECLPIGEYATTKLQAERLLLASGAIEAVILRFPAIYAVERLDDVRKRAYLPMTGNRVQLRLGADAPLYSLCAVSCAAEAVVAAATMSLPAGTYNVSDPRPYAQAEVARVIAAVDGRRPALHMRAAVLGAILGASSRLLPSRLRPRMHANVSKLLDGLVLDTSRLEKEGFVASADFTRLLDASPS
jgi:nucleoside-diphosphate-sugar epimerase